MKSQTTLNNLIITFQNQNQKEVKINFVRITRSQNKNVYFAEHKSNIFFKRNINLKSH